MLYELPKIDGFFLNEAEFIYKASELNSATKIHHLAFVAGYLSIFLRGNLFNLYSYENKLNIMKYISIIFYWSLTFQIAFSQDLEERISLKDTSYISSSGKQVDAQKGSLLVPENRENPNSENIPVYFIRLKSTNENPQAPLIYLEGGPGSSCTWQAAYPEYLERWVPFLELGDVILLDQRGTGAGVERVLYIYPEDPHENVLADISEFESHVEKVSAQALEGFQRRGVDLNGYTSIENARDVDDLRQILGYQKISLLGFSYGTHLGQTYIKYFSENVQNAVLAGVEGLNHTFKLPSTMDTQIRKIALLANQDEHVNQEVPDFITLYKEVVQKLDENPVTLEVLSPLTQAPMQMKVGSFGLNLLLRIDIGDASDIPVFPRLLYNIKQGDYSALQWFVQKRIGAFYGINGMATTMDEASGASTHRLERIEAEERVSLFKNTVNPKFNTEWPVPDLGDTFREPLISNVRTLLMSGTLDFNTPPHQAEEVRWGFANSSHIIIPYAGHEQILTHPKAGETIIRFLKGENIDNIAFSYPKIEFIPVTGEIEERSHPSLHQND